MTGEGGISTRSRIPGYPTGVALLPSVVLPALALVVLVITVALRVAYPFALEWQETAMAEHALRVLSGSALYVEPTPEFAPFPYPPMFHWLGAGAMSLFGVELYALRSISILSTVAICAMLFAVERGAAREACSAAVAAASHSGGARTRTTVFVGLVSAGVFAATYGFGGAWFDVARVDMLALALGVGALLLARSLECSRPNGAVDPSSRRSARWLVPVAAGVLLACSVLTKQTLLGLAVVVPIGLALRGSTRQAGVTVGVTTAVSLAVTTAWLERQSDGGFLFTTVDLLAGSPWYGPAVGGFWWEAAPLLLAPALLWLLSARAGVRSWTMNLSLVALVGMAWLGRAHEGGYLNTLIPAGLAAALGVARFFPSALARAPWRTTLVVVATFAWLAYDPRPLVPTAADRAEGARVAARIAQVRGRVWQPGGALEAGESGLAHRMTIVDLLKSRETEAALTFARSLEEELDGHAFDAIVLSHPVEDWAAFAPAIRRNYRELERLDGGPNVVEGDEPFEPPTGAPIRPRILLVPR